MNLLKSLYIEILVESPRKKKEYHEGIPRKNQGGDCFQAAGRYLMDKRMFNRDDSTPMFVVHGRVSGQGPVSGVRYPHGWVEEGEGEDAIVIDVSQGKNLRMPKRFYYALGHIQERQGELKRYTSEELRKKIVTTGNWGPWPEDINVEVERS